MHQNSSDPFGKNWISISNNHTWLDNWDHFLRIELNFTEASQPLTTYVHTSNIYIIMFYSYFILFSCHQF